MPKYCRDMTVALILAEVLLVGIFIQKERTIADEVAQIKNLTQMDKPTTIR